MVRIIKHFVMDFKVYYKLLLFILLIVFVPLCYLTYSYFNGIQKTVEVEMKAFYEQIVNQYKENLLYKLDIYNILLENITSNTLVIDNFSNDNTADPTQMLDTSILTSRKLNKMDIFKLSSEFSKEINSLIFKGSKNEIYRIKLYSFDKDFPSDGRYLSSVTSVEDTAWYKKARASSFSTCFLGNTEGMKINTITIVKPIIDLSAEDFLKSKGFAKIDIRADVFFGNLFTNKGEGTQDLFVLDNEQGTLIYSSRGKEASPGNEIIKQVLASNSGKITTMGHEGKEMLIYNNVNDKLKILLMVPYSDIQKKVLSNTISVIIILGLLIIFFVYLTTLFTKSFSNRISTLIQKMKTVEEGNLYISEQLTGNDEIGTLDRYFNRMIGKLKDLINENYIQKLKKNEAELLALQAQINPHFLYNTLDLVDSMASVYGCKDINTVVKSMADLFRYSINSDQCEFVTLEDEISHVEKYLNIQKMRYEGSLEVFFDIPEELMYCKVLKLIVQPVVENAICHGIFQKGNKGIIRIYAVLNGNDVIMEVSDNGVGMDEWDLHQVMLYINGKNDSFDSKYKKSIGLLNVNTRLKLKFGEKYGVSIKSRPDVGTSVSIMLPFDFYPEGGQVCIKS